MERSMKIRLDGWAQQIAEECAPIIIAAPTARCGTTAIQRLLHTDPSVVVYGEDPTLVDMAVYMRHRIHGLQASRETAERVRRRSRANEWQARSTTDVDARSEEHTSELQSLMRTSYTVSCFKKKINITQPS